MQFIAFQVVAQQTKVQGVVFDASTKDPIPFVNVFVKGTNIGATADFEGKYSLLSKSKSDTLVFSSMGYITAYYKLKIGSFQEVNLGLVADKYELSEVVIHPGENPAHPILRNVIAKKEINNQYSIDALQYEVYNKIQFDANNLSEKYRNKKYLKPFEFIFDYIDTSEVNGKSYLPIFISESVSDIYYRKQSGDFKEYIKASQASGIKNESVSLFLGNMYLDIRLYSNYIKFFEKNFISPISDNAFLTYKYYLIDSLMVGDSYCYKIMFKPKRKQEMTFSGELLIDKETWAIKQAKMKMSEDANLNFINAFEFKQSFVKVDGYWIVENENIFIDVNLLENSKSVAGLYCHKSSSFKNIVVNKPKADAFYKTPVDVFLDESSLERDENYWKNARHEELNAEEKMIYAIVDTIKNIHLFQTYYDVISTITTGYYSFEKYDLGPYFQTFSFNSLEGYRFRIGGQTGYNWNDKLRFFGHVAYGTNDKVFKYQAGVTYMPERNPMRKYGLSYKSDVEQLGQSPNALTQDNILASVFRRRPFTKLTMVEELNGFYEHEWFTGLSNKITVRQRNIFPVDGSDFEFYPNTGNAEVRNSITTTELEFNFRFAYKEKFFIDKFTRSSLGSKYPIVNFWYNYGVPSIFGGEYEYSKFELSVNHWFNIGGLGYSRYILSAGKIFGTLPFPLLIIHPGNETYSFDEQSFNKMNYYEFISDEYVSLYYTHHFEGFFLNHFPLMRKLRWREVIYAKALVGSLSGSNKNYSKFLPFSGGLNKPYIEGGIAIENIFRVLRVDANWRFTQLSNPEVVPFGLMVTLQLQF